MKKIAVLLCAALFAFPPAVLAEDTAASAAPAASATPAPSADSGQQLMSFNLEQAIEYALNNHPQLLAAQSNVTKNQVALDEATYLYNSMQKKNAYIFDDGRSGEGTFTAKKGLGVKRAQTALTISQIGLEQAQASVKFGVESAFYTYLGMSDKVKAAKDEYDLAQKKLEDMQRKKELGLASDFDVLAVKALVKQEGFSLNKAMRDMENAEYNFKSAVGLDSNTKVQLTGSLELPKMPGISIDDAVAKAKENRYEVISGLQNYLLSEEAFRVTALWYEEKTYMYQEAKYAVDASRYSYLNSLNAAELSVRKAYSDMKNAYEALDVLDSNIELSRKAYELAQKRFEIGLATGIDVSDAFQKLADLNISRADAVLGCVLAARQFEYSYSIGVAAH